jgi:outer membrane protein
LEGGRSSQRRGFRKGAFALAAILLLGALHAPSADGEGATAEPRRISLSEAIDIALRQNSSVLRAENATAANRAAVSDASMRFLPDLQLGLSGSRSTAQSGTESGTSFRAGLSSSVVLFNGMARVAELRAARLEAAAGEKDLERSRQTVVFQVITGYLAMIEATEQVRVQEENLAAQQEQEKSVRALVEEGQRPISELYQQESNVAAAQLSSVESRRTLELSRVDLVQVLQLEPTGDYDFEIPPVPAIDADASEPELSALLERALRTRADAGAVTHRSAAAGEQVRSAKAEYWPALSLSADYGTGYAGTADDAFFDQLDLRRSGSVGLSVSVPLFDRFAARNGVRRAKISRDNAQLNESDMEQEVALQVRRAVLDWNTAHERLRAADARARASRQALDSTNERYAAGAATLYEVTLSRSDFVAAESGLVSARYNLLWQGRLLDYYVGDLDPADGLGEARSKL